MGLRVGRLRHEAVLSDEVHGHVPLPAVADGIVEHEVGGAIIDGSIGAFDDGPEEVIRAPQLVPEVDVGLAELKVLEVHLLHGTHSEEVQCGEEPAATAALLMGDRPIVQLGAEGIVHGLNLIPI